MRFCRRSTCVIRSSSSCRWRPAPHGRARHVQAQARDGSPWTLRVGERAPRHVAGDHPGGPFAARRRQAHALIDALGARAEEPTILAGDYQHLVGPHRAGGEHPAQPPFRQTPRHPEPGHVARSRSASTRSSTTCFCAGRWRRRRCSGFRAGSDSDHYPLLAVVALTPPPQKRRRRPGL
jgi:hypothetical protein